MRIGRERREEDDSADFVNKAASRAPDRVDLLSPEMIVQIQVIAYKIVQPRSIDEEMRHTGLR
jgi:hypothetical protein